VVILDLVYNPAMQERMLKARRRAARALARMEGIHAPAHFIMAFADPISNSWVHRTFLNARGSQINYMFEPPLAKKPTAPEMEPVLQKILELDLGLTQLEARGIVQSAQCTSILRCLLSPHFTHVLSLGKCITELRKKSKRYPKITSEVDKEAL
jgi:hypothetical protein